MSSAFCPRPRKIAKSLVSECTPSATITRKRHEGDSWVIAQASRQYGLSADTLRYYERIGLIPPVPRNKSGIRDYDQASCQWIELMKCMRAAGVQIEALVEYVELFRQGDATLEAREALLMEQRDLLMTRMEEMQ